MNLVSVLFILCAPPQLLVTASRALLLKQWDWRQAQCTRTWRAIHTVPVASMTFDSTSTLLATGQRRQNSSRQFTGFCLICGVYLSVFVLVELQVAVMEP